VIHARCQRAEPHVVLDLVNFALINLALGPNCAPTRAASAVRSPPGPKHTRLLFEPCSTPSDLLLSVAWRRCPQLLAVGPVRYVALFAEEACALILSDVWTTGSDPVATFCARPPQARLSCAEAQGRFRNIVRQREPQPATCFVTGAPSRTKHAPTNVARVPSEASPHPRWVHAAIGRLL